jgi:hypothetical protein
MEVNGQLHAPAALPQGKSPWYPLDRVIIRDVVVLLLIIIVRAVIAQ